MTVYCSRLPAVVRQGVTWLACLVLGAFATQVMGATTVTPVIIDVPSDGRATVMVRNDRARDVLYQVTFMTWHVVNGADHYAVTQDFIASPPLFTLSPSASQVVRIGFRKPARLPLEQAYRLVLAEVPQSIDAQSEGGVVDFALQYLLPVFVAPSGRGVKPALTWSLRSEGNAVVVRADNPGTTRTVLNMVGLNSRTGLSAAPEIAIRQRTTVLAHAWREWRFQVPVHTSGLPWRIVALLSGSDALLVVPDADMRPSPSP